MAMQDLKKDIEQRLLAFDRGDLTACGLALFQQLGYETDKRMGWSGDGADDFLLETNGEGLLNLEKAKTGEWREFSLLFQLTRDEIAGGRQTRLDFGTNNQVDRNNYESYLFLGLRLGEETYSRKELAEITRQINKLFAMPVMVVFRYGALLTLAMIDRRPSKADASRDVLEKVTLIKDVMVRNPNRAHVEILYDLSLEALHKAHKFTDFLGLHRAWQKTLDISELNKQFFKELANWYFWTIAQVKFPDGAPKDGEGTDSPSVIRMITRLVFVWFLKEKGLVPDELFNQSDVKRLIHFETGDASSYYKAILQNLFFATLNQEMNTAKKSDNRKFRGKSKSGGRDQHYGVANTYRYEDLMRLPEEMLALFETVPFLNGGLFECLDDTEVTPAIRMDGFSDRADNQLLVPNQVFFSEEQDVDLNGTYGTKNKKYKVRGLIDILNRYKFTIAENTPLEQEIALDPELLGKVFENLLASYNEETKATARKQTGSFYTPREVVDYMVDESLKVYFGNALEASEGVELRLSRLLDYNSEGHDFGSAEVDRLIGAIDRLKMLDPAVGSGAFPMGILQKLVFVLSKLDPQNKRWRDAQIATAEGIEDIEARENAIVGIDEAFGRNELDYGRKLFLIQNCVYGVDIQPIAVQIAKLRFFISLIVEQKISEDVPNRGIRPLPNLETKFVAANTLMGLGGQVVLKTQEIEQKEQQLAKARKDHFGARTRQTKDRCRERDRTLRGEIGELLMGLGFPGETATKMSSWNPYDQNITSSFFEPSWMFGVQDGFDVVIGNPPYVRQESIKHLKDALKPIYECYTGTADLYVFFYERGLKLLRDRGVLTYISSNKYFRSNYGKLLRSYLTSRSTIHQIIDFGDAPVFTAIAYPTIVIAENAKAEKHQVKALNWEVGQPIERFASVVREQSFLMPQASLNTEGWQFANDESLALLDRLRKTGMRLGDYIGNRFYRGVLTGFNEAFVVDRETRDRLIAEHLSSEEVLKPFLRGRDVKRWKVEDPDLWIIFTRRGIDIKKYPAILNHLSQFQNRLTPGTPSGRKDGSYKWYEIQDNIAYWQEFGRSKIIIPSIDKQANYAFDDKGFYTNDKTSICYTDSPLYLLGLLNSQLLFWIIQQTA